MPTLNFLILYIPKLLLAENKNIKNKFYKDDVRVSDFNRPITVRLKRNMLKILNIYFYNFDE